MKKIFIISFLILFLAPVMVSAVDNPYCAQIPDKDKTGGIVPCGRDCNDPSTAADETVSCGLCHLFVMTNNIIQKIFKWVAPTIAVLMLIIGGALFLFGGAKPDTITRAKGIITSVVIGLLIIFSAWVIVNTVFEKLKIVNMPSGWKWWEIKCSAENTTMAQMPEQAAPPTPPMPPVLW